MIAQTQAGGDKSCRSVTIFSSGFTTRIGAVSALQYFKIVAMANTSLSFIAVGIVCARLANNSTFEWLCIDSRPADFFYCTRNAWK